MAFTRANVESEVVDQLGALLTLAGKPTTVDGTNAYLNGPIAAALQAMGVTPASPALVVDADFATVPDSQFTLTWKLSLYYGIQKCLIALPLPNERAQDRQQDWNDMLKRYKDMFAAMSVELAPWLTILPNPTVSGTPCLRFPTPGTPGFAIGWGRIDH